MAEPPAKPAIVQWIVDTRNLWPTAEKTAQLETEVCILPRPFSRFTSNHATQAARALALLNPEERKSVLRYLFVRDAKMSLASHLLKHYVISKTLDLPWAETKITRNAKTKPIYAAPDPSNPSPIDFNVSHQAGLVALVAAHGSDVDVGCDVVCMSERADRDQAMIAKEGWPAFVDMHADVFAPGEAAYLKHRILSAIPGALPAGASAKQVNEFKLRCFYTLWCLREAYVKMTGEALLAPWLNVLEFKNFRPPRPQEEMGKVREDVEDVVKVEDVWFEGRRVDDANVCLRSLGSDYMTCSAVRTPQNKEVGRGLDLGAYDVVEMSEILDYAESRL